MTTSVAPKERGILFSAPMVRAILAGRKTVTRRLVKERMHLIVDGDETTGRVVEQSDPSFGALATEHARCPYGEPGERLWIKETWRPRVATAGGLVPDSADVTVTYAADGAELFFRESQVPGAWTMPKAAERGWVTPLHMPRWAARLLLEVTDVRIERLHEMTDAEAMLEGVQPTAPTTYPSNGCSSLENFRHLWARINGGSWSTNPWVWRVAFRPMHRVTNAEEPK